MKFVSKHRSDILDIIGLYNLPESDFDFVKRRGRICIRYRQSGMEFSYLRKRVTRLDPISKQWKNLQWFKIKSAKAKEISVENWEQVMDAFKEWVFALNHSSQN